MYALQVPLGWEDESGDSEDETDQPRQPEVSDKAIINLFILDTYESDFSGFSDAE